MILSGSGNRPRARDVVIVITDGKSQDDVVAPAQRLHDTNALVCKRTTKHIILETILTKSSLKKEP